MNPEPQPPQRKKPGRKPLKKNLQNANKEGNEEENDNSAIRCPCGDNVDKGLMIQCETCLVWQHSICVGIRDDKAVPPNYFCEICLPRNFKCVCQDSTPTGKLIECTQCNTWQHVRCLNKRASALNGSYRCPTCAPEEFQQAPAKRGRKKNAQKLAKSSLPKNFDFVTSPFLKNMLEKDCNYLATVKDNLHEGKILLPSKQDVIERYSIKFCDHLQDTKMDFHEVLKGISLLLESPLDQVKERFEEIVQELSETKLVQNPQISVTNPMEGWVYLKNNIYNSSGKLDEAIDESNILHGDAEVSELGSPVALDITKLANGDWGVIVLSDLKQDQFIQEYLGKVIHLKELDYQFIPQKDKHFVLPNLEPNQDSFLCIDARMCGNKCRFIRRSCKPNSILKTVNINDKLHVGVYAIQDITNNSEITIQFESIWKDSKTPLSCPCQTAECPIVSWFKNRQSVASSALSDIKAASFSSDSDSDPDDDGRRKKKKKKDMAYLAEIKNQPQLSREERKLALMIQSFEKMEKLQTRKRRERDITKPKRKKGSDDSASSGNDYEDTYSEDEKPPKPVVIKPPGKKRGRKPKVIVMEKDSDKSEEDGKEKVETPLPSKTPTVKIEKPPVQEPPKEQKVEEKPTPETQEVPLSPMPTSPARTAFKGKKAWIKQFEEKSKQEPAPADKGEESTMHKFPLKKKMILQESYNENNNTPSPPTQITTPPAPATLPNTTAPLPSSAPLPSVAPQINEEPKKEENDQKPNTLESALSRKSSTENMTRIPSITERLESVREQQLDVRLPDSQPLQNITSTNSSHPGSPQPQSPSFSGARNQKPSYSSYPQQAR